MILDVNTVLDSNRALTVTATSSGVYDTAGLGVGNPVANIFGNVASFGNDIGSGGPNNASPPQLLALVGTAFTAGGAATMRVQLQAAVDTNNTGTPGTWQTIDQTDDYAVALLVAGAQVANFTVPRRYLGQNFPRFYRLNYVIGTGPMTAGTIAYAGLLTGIDDNPIYPGNF